MLKRINGVLGESLKKLEDEKGIVVRFVIGHRYAIFSVDTSDCD